MKINQLFSLLFLIVFSTTMMAQTHLAQFKPVGSKTWGYINEEGKVVIKAEFEKCFLFSDNGLATIYDKKQGGFFFINTEGKRLKTDVEKFELMEGGFGLGLKAYDEGMAPIREKKTWGYLNSDGKLVIPMKYESVSMFSGGYAFAKNGNDFMVLSKDGTEKAIKGDIKEIRHFSEGFAPYKDAEGKMGFVNTSGEFAIKAQFKSVGHFIGGLAWAKDENDKVGFVDTKGSWVIKPTFDAAQDFEIVSGMARVKLNDAWSYINKEGKVLVLKADTDFWGEFENGLAKGRKDKKFGFFDNTGEWVIKPTFDAVGEVSGDFIAAKQGDLWGFINLKGDWVIKPQFEGVKKMIKLKK